MTSKVRVRKYLEQGGLCDCCGVEMWEVTLETRSEFRTRLFGSPGAGPTRKEISRRICTREHVRPRCDGPRQPGEHLDDVATCAWCNAMRGLWPYAEFRMLVRDLGSAEAAAVKLRLERGRANARTRRRARELGIDGCQA